LNLNLFFFQTQKKTKPFPGNYPLVFGPNHRRAGIFQIDFTGQDVVIGGHPEREFLSDFIGKTPLLVQVLLSDGQQFIGKQTIVEGRGNILKAACWYKWS